ncbi:MAG: YqiJ family protein, partial [Proteobacteria bacterium]|nr:YqiJ family protein [Pseudomonadota bacterium]
MLEFLAAPQNLPFTVALCVMLGIAILEGVGTLLGAGLSSLLDSLVGEIDFDVDADADVDADVHGPGHVGGGLFTGLLGWLRFGRVPVMAVETTRLKELQQFAWPLFRYEHAARYSAGEKRDKKARALGYHRPTYSGSSQYSLARAATGKLVQQAVGWTGTTAGSKYIGCKQGLISCELLNGFPGVLVECEVTGQYGFAILLQFGL